MKDEALLDERQLALNPFQRRPRREPQTNQELSPQLDFLQRVEYQFANWVQFADAKAGGVILVLSIGALDVFHKARDYFDARNLAHPTWGWIALVSFVAAVLAMAVTVVGVARTLFPKILESRPSDNFFGVVSQYPDGEAYGAKVMGMREVELINSLSIQCWSLANIANDKYAHLRRAYGGAMLFLVAWGVARVSLSFAS